MISTCNNIPPIQNCQGYIWMSDQSTPHVLNGYFEGISLIPSNPFIIEGHLFDRDTRKSISIRHVDGKYVINIADTGKFKNATRHRFVASWGDTILLFDNEWIPEKDPLCENMEVLTSSDFSFVGFEKMN